MRTTGRSSMQPLSRPLPLLHVPSGPYCENVSLLCSFAPFTIYAERYRCDLQLAPSLNLNLSAQDLAKLDINGNNDSISVTLPQVNDDPNYKLVPCFYGTKLVSIDCLLTAVDAALQLALGQYDGMVFGQWVLNLVAHRTLKF